MEKTINLVIIKFEVDQYSTQSFYSDRPRYPNELVVQYDDGSEEEVSLNPWIAAEEINALINKIKEKL